MSPDSNWVELKSLDSTFIYDIRYAGVNNFTGKKMYPCAKCFLRPEVAGALLKIQKELRKKGLRLKIFDCYRPGKVQWELWKIRPDPHYVANPRKGSMHNRGLAVDLTITDQSGKEWDMGTPYDYFGPEAYHAYKNLSPTVRKNRAFLKEIMQKHGLMPIESEWWHYSYRKKTYPVEQWILSCD
jgi:D-alanyl-D-alanine dipeptidase